MISSEEEEPRAEERPARLRLSLVIPAFNESRRLEAAVSRLLDAMATGRIDPATTEFVVVDDGSTDATSDCAESLFGQFPHRRVIRLAENRGKGAAVRSGVSAASAPVIAFADADMSIDPAQTPDFLQALTTADVAIGSRSSAGASVDRRSIRRSAMNRTFNRMVNALTGVGLNDTQCGFKSFRSPAAKLLFHCSITERFAFDVEILSLARRLGLTIAQVPVQWSRVEGSRTRPWLDPGSMTRDVIRASRLTTTAPPVPALVVRGDGTMSGPDPSVAFKALAQELSPVVPVLRRSDGRVLVLCPLMREPQIENIAGRMKAHFGEAPVDRLLLTAKQLTALSPLSLCWDV